MKKITTYLNMSKKDTFNVLAPDAIAVNRANNDSTYINVVFNKASAR